MTWTKGKSILIAGGGVLLLILAVLILQRVFQSDTVRLSDGSEVRVREVSFGKTHPFPDVPPWQPMLLALPTNITTRLGFRRRTHRTMEDTLVVWFEWQRGTNSLPYPQWLRVIDSNGLASPSIYVGPAANHTNTAFLGFDIANFPRDESTLLLELRGVDSARNQPSIPRDLAKFRIRNPCLVQRPRRSPTVWPTSTFADGEQFTLLAINTGLWATGVWTRLTLTNQWTELLFRIGTNEPAQRTTHPLDFGPWGIKSIELRDAFGNFISTGRDPPLGRILPVTRQYMMRNDDGIALIPGAVWPDETWNIRAVFDRQAASSFDAAHRWTTSIPIPEPGGKISLNQTGRVEGCEIRLHSIENAKAAQSPAPFGASVTTAELSATISLSFIGKDSSYHWNLLSAEDQGGLALRRGFDSTIHGQKNEIKLYPLQNTMSAKITIGVTHPVTVELSGKATILRENVMRWAPKQ